MSKRTNATEKNILTWLHRGDGQGEGIRFRPFFHVRDVPSKGRSTMVEGLKVKRTHHYLSDLEYGYHLLAEFSPDVIDIREQYALLPREETEGIAHALGVSHPVYSNTGVLRVLTSDLVLTKIPGARPAHTVISCKYTSDLNPAKSDNRRTLEKMLIEKIYWSRRDTPWILGTEEMLPANKTANLDFFRQTMTSRELDHLTHLLARFVQKFEAVWSEKHTMNELLKLLADDMKISMEHTFTLLGRAIWTRLLDLDLDSEKFAHESPIRLRAKPALEFGGDSRIINV